MPRLYEITVPGLSVKSDLRAARNRLIREFPEIQDVLATLTPATLLVAYDGRDRIDEWLDTLSESVMARRGDAGRPACARPRQWAGAVADVRALRPGA